MAKHRFFWDVMPAVSSAAQPSSTRHFFGARTHLMRANYKQAPLTSSGDHRAPTEDRDLDLPLDSTYCTKFNSHSALRELIQNCYDGSKNTALDLAVKDVLVRRSEDPLRFRFVGAGYIFGGLEFAPSTVYQGKTKCTIVNYGVNLISNLITVMGRTSKGSGKKQSNVANEDEARYKNTRIEGQVGRFGEGALCGILALLREQRSVVYYTNGQRWNFSLVVDAQDSSKRVLHFTEAQYKTEKDVLVVEIDGLEVNQRFHTYWFLNRSTFPSQSVWRLLPKDQKHLLSGIEIKRNTDRSRDGYLYNRSFLLACQDGLPFDLNIFGSIDSLGRDRNHSGASMYVLIRDHILPFLACTPVAVKNYPELITDDGASLVIFLYAVLNSQDSYREFQSSMRACYEKTNNLSAQWRKFGKLLFQECAQSSKIENLVPIDVATQHKSIRRFQDAGADPSQFVAVSSCLFAIFEVCGFLKDIETNARKIREALFQAPSTSRTLPFQDFAEIQRDLLFHASQFSHCDQLGMEILDVSQAKLEPHLLKRLSSYQLAQFQYNKQQKLLIVLSSCFDSRHLHKIQNEVFATEMLNGKKFSVRKLQCGKDGKICRCLQSMVLKEIAKKHNWDEISIARHWAQQGAPTKGMVVVHETIEVESEGDDFVENAFLNSTKCAKTTEFSLPHPAPVAVTTDYKHKPNNGAAKIVAVTKQNTEIQQIFQVASRLHSSDLNIPDKPRQLEPLDHGSYDCDGSVYPTNSLSFSSMHSCGIAFYVDRSSVDSTECLLADTLRFSELLGQLAHMFEKVDVRNLIVYYDSKNNMHAFNNNGCIWFNLQSFIDNAKSMSNFQQAYFWYDTFCHELSHNVHGLHNRVFWSLQKELRTEFISDFRSVFSSIN